MMQMKSFILSFPAVLLVLFCSCGSGTKPVENKSGEIDSENYTLVWSDEFDYSGLPDSSLWTYDMEGNAAGWGNNEAQYYTEKRL